MFDMRRDASSGLRTMPSDINGLSVGPRALVIALTALGKQASAVNNTAVGGRLGARCNRGGLFVWAARLLGDRSSDDGD